MATFMSPLDPIFWLHHANIDRLWEVWRGLPRSIAVTDPGGASTLLATTWRSAVFVSGLLNIETLAYRYIPPLLAPAQLLVTPSVIDLNRLPPVARLENIPAAQVNTPLNMPVQLNQTQAQALVGAPKGNLFDLATAKGRGI